MLNSIMEEFDRRVRRGRPWRSFFRYGWPEDAWGRSQAITSNVFLHLHPVKVRRHGVKITYTYCMGGISFLLFLILVVTGVLLMFYYHPSV
ncbi:MAG: cytochrome B6, partial [Dehalococcoidia bacterium]|nr:cytochrome B6 [Dehalococcoidia bacterium]